MKHVQGAATIQTNTAKEGSALLIFAEMDSVVVDSVGCSLEVSIDESRNWQDAETRTHCVSFTDITQE